MPRNPDPTPPAAPLGTTDSVADELYAHDPSGFVQARDAAVKQLLAEGRKADAAAIKALRRPSAVGWALNLLVREDRVQLDSLLSVGEELRRAQTTLSGEALRDLTRQRHQVVRAVAARAGELAAAAGRPLSPSVLDQVGRSLDAALTDPDAATELLTGRVLGELTYAGLGSAASPPALRVVSGSDEETPAPSRSALAEHRRAVRAAEKAVAEAAGGLEDADERLGRARAAADAANLRVAAAEETLTAAQAELEAAQHDEEVAERAAELAAKTQDRAARRLAAAEDHLSTLR